MRAKFDIRSRITGFKMLITSLNRFVHDGLEVAQKHEAIRALEFVLNSGLPESELIALAEEFEAMPENEARVWAEQIRWCLDELCQEEEWMAEQDEGGAV